MASLAHGRLYAQSFDILPRIPSGTFGVTATDVSDDGTVVVGVSHDGSRNQAVRWDGTTIQGFGYVQQQNPGTSGAGVSGDGKVVVGISTYFLPNSQAVEEAARWIGTTREDLGYLGSVTLSRASAASRDGSVVVGRSHTGTEIQAFRWENGVMTGLGTLGGQVSEAFDVTPDGRVVVGRSQTPTSGSQYEAFRWEAGQMTSLGFPGGTPTWWNASAQSVSADGRVIVGTVSALSGEVVPFRWENGQMDVLELLPGCFRGEAFGVSEDGGVIVGALRCTEGASSVNRAFIWMEAGGMRDLEEELVSRYGLNLAGWRILSAASISPDGLAVIGAAFNAAEDPIYPRPFKAILGESSAIVVNSTDNEEDGSPTDAACDTGDRVTIDGASVPECTLRAAIATANRRGGARITFDIPGEGVPSIPVLDTALPIFEAEIDLDATTQPGGWVELVGDDALPSTASGIEVGPLGDRSRIRGLVIHGFPWSGLFIDDGADGCTIESNRIGTDPTGIQMRGNGTYDAEKPWAGVWVDAHETRIVRNVIAGNLSGGPSGDLAGTDVLIRGDRNVLEGNQIGVGADGKPLSLPSIVSFYVGIWIGAPTIDVEGAADNVIGGPGDIGGPGGNGNEAVCSSPTCNTIQGHTVEILLGTAQSSQPTLAGLGNIIGGNVIGSTGNPLNEFLIRTDVGIFGFGSGGGSRIAYNHVEARDNGIDVRTPKNEILGNRVIAARQTDLVGEGVQRNSWGGILSGEEASVTLNTVSAQWSSVIVGAGSSVTNNTLTGGLESILVDSDSPSVFAADNEFGCGSSGGLSRIIYLGGYGRNPTFNGDRAARRNDWGDLDGYQNSPIIVRAVQRTDGVYVLGYVRGNALASMFAFEANCGLAEGADARVEVDASNLGRTDFEMVIEQVAAQFVFTATRDGVSTSEGTYAAVTSEAQLSTIDVPEIGPGASASGQGAYVTVTDGGGKRAGVASGQLFISRYDVRADSAFFADTTATSAGGMVVLPESIAFRTWMLRDLGLTGDSIDPALGATVDVCFEVADVVKAEAVDNVVVVQRAGVGLPWFPLDTTREERDAGTVLCSRGLKTLGEFGIGGTPEAFPVAVERDEVVVGVPAQQVSIDIYPNPVRDAATIRLTLPSGQRVRVEAFDTLGRRVAVLQEGILSSGVHPIHWNAEGLPGGVYFIRVGLDGVPVATRRVVLMP